MHRKPTCTCVIPCYNEAPRVPDVLTEVLQAEHIDEVVVIDDGSTDNTAEVIKKKFPQVRLIQLDQNMGKTEAIRQGIREISSTYTMMIDADLRGVKAAELSNAANLAKKRLYDMLVLRRVSHPITVKLLRGDILITGERVVRTSLLKEVLRQNITDFQIEVALNQHTLDNYKSVAWSPSSGMSVPWLQKSNISTGIKKEVDMFSDLFKYIGFKNLMRQYLFFCWDRAR